jgi:hypothetical protein
VTLYDEDQVLALREEGELPLERLLLRLSLRRRPGGVAAALEAGSGSLHVAARRALGHVLVDFLFRSRVPARVAICETARASAFGGGRTFWLFRLAAVPPRLLGLLARTPGLVPYVQVLDDVLVEAAHEHPVHLASCRTVFRSDRLLLLSPPPHPAMEISPRPTLVALEDLVKVAVRSAEESVAPADARGQPSTVEVNLRLERVPGQPARPRAALVPWSQAVWLRRLLFALPQLALRSYQVTFVRAGVLLLAPERIEGIPFGQLLEEAAPGVLVPVGMRLRPALSRDLLVERLGLTQGALCVFPDQGAAPFRVAAAQLEPLERRALARTDLPWAPDAGRVIMPSASVDAGPPPEIENELLGVLPLWGLERPAR